MEHLLELEQKGQIPTANTLTPTLTGSSVVALAYDGGVAVASDKSVFFGKMERFHNATRHYRVNNSCLVVFSGDFADFQWLQNLLERKQLELQRGSRKQFLKPAMVHAFLSAFFYQRRSKLNPLWNTVVVCGMQPVEFEAGKCEPFIGVINMYGIAYQTKYAATELGAFLLNQLLETRLKESKDGKLTKEMAVSCIDEALKVSVYRNCRAGKTYDLTIIDSEGVHFGEPQKVIGEWEIAEKYNAQYF